MLSPPVARADVAPAAARLPSLTGLRGPAALVVFLTHVGWVFYGRRLPGGLEVKQVLQQGVVGVSLFFILSGFVLTWSRRSTDTYSGFMGRRFARIYPAHVAVWVLWLGVVAAGTREAFAVGPMITNLFLVQAWIPSQTWYFGYSGVPWSLSVEVFFYACFPFLVAVLTRRQLRVQRWVAVAMMLTSIGIAVGLTVLPAFSAATAHYLAYVFPIFRLPEFVLGMALALLVRDGRLPRIPLGVTVVLAVVAFLVAGQVIGPASLVAITLVPFALMITAAAQVDLAGRSSILSSRLVVHLGEVSYAFYLVHTGVINILREQLLKGESSSNAMAVAWVAMMFAGSLAVAELVHFLVERPVERWLRPRLARFSDSRRAADLLVDLGDREEQSAQVASK